MNREQPEQRGFLSPTLIAAIVVGVVIIGLGIAVKVQSARLASEKAAHAETQAKFSLFVAQTKAIGEEAQKKADTEIKRQKGVNDATVKSLETRLAATRAQFDKLRGSGESPGRGSLPPVPSTARPADDAARDKRLLEVLRIAQEQTDALIEIQSWVTQQGQK